jgi:NHL repeat
MSLLRRSVVRAALAIAALSLAGAALGTSAAAPTITTVAGTGVDGRSGDGGPASAAAIGHPRGLALAPGGGYVFAEPFNETVRRVWPDGTITTIAGTGAAGFAGDGGPAAQAELNQPHGVAFTPSGGLLVADTLNNRIRLISLDGTISTAAGTGTAGFLGDGGPATGAEIDAPRGVTALPDGGFLIPDTDNQRIRRVSPDGQITTLAGNGTRGFAGDGGPAGSAELASPFGVVPTSDGGMLIADTGNDRVRRVSPGGTITTVAGDGRRGYGGDGGPATSASLDSPHNLAVLPDGGFLVADAGNNRVRRVLPNGTITTVAGNGTQGFSGDGGPPREAELNLPKALLVLADSSGFLLADAQNNRIRLVILDLRLPFVLRVARPSLHVKAGRSAILPYSVSLPSTVRLEVRRGSRLVLSIRGRAKAGSNKLVFGRVLGPGSYALRLLAVSPDGRTARAKGTLGVAR